MAKYKHRTLRGSIHEALESVTMTIFSRDSPRASTLEFFDREFDGFFFVSFFLVLELDGEV